MSSQLEVQSLLRKRLRLIALFTSLVLLGSFPAWRLLMMGPGSILLSGTLAERVFGPEGEEEILGGPKSKRWSPPNCQRVNPTCEATTKPPPWCPDRREALELA
jgi:hypothetical protein